MDGLQASTYLRVGTRGSGGRRPPASPGHLPKLPCKGLQSLPVLWPPGPFLRELAGRSAWTRCNWQEARAADCSFSRAWGGQLGKRGGQEATRRSLLIQHIFIRHLPTRNCWGCQGNSKKEHSDLGVRGPGEWGVLGNRAGKVQGLELSSRRGWGGDHGGHGLQFRVGPGQLLRRWHSIRARRWMSGMRPFSGRGHGTCKSPEAVQSLVCVAGAERRQSLWVWAGVCLKS
jgi:hypothetical protein